MAHAPEKLIGELVLFFLDIAVNQESNLLLYRLHDDLWLVGKPDNCARAWDTMQTFASVMGVEYNKNKTGSVYLVQNAARRIESVAKTLPQGMLPSVSSLFAETLVSGSLTRTKSTNMWSSFVNSSRRGTASSRGCKPR
jgi:hypothetical protein